MPYKRVLTVQDISCAGQCSMTVALPILSACGTETCVLPSAVLSTHTGGFGEVNFRDLTGDMPAVANHWERAGITFDAITTGYLGSIRQIGYVEEILDKLMAPGGISIVDPAMADHGKLYKGFDEAYVDAMRRLCARGNILIPNLTEACMLTGESWKEEFTRQELVEILKKLTNLGAGCVLLTGVSLEPGKTGVALWQNGELKHYSQIAYKDGHHLAQAYILLENLGDAPILLESSFVFLLGL